MAKKKEVTKTEKTEREYTIPLREKVRPVPRYKKTPKAVKSIKEFLARHMKIRDRDLKKIKIDSYLNEQIWMRGIKNPVHKIRVKVIKEDDVVRVYSAELPANINFKKIKEEKIEREGKEAVEKKKTFAEKAKESLQGKKEEAAKTEEEKNDEKEKEETSKISQENLEKEQAKEMKHTTKIKNQNQKKAERKGYDITSRGR